MSKWIADMFFNETKNIVFFAQIIGLRAKVKLAKLHWTQIKNRNKEIVQHIGTCAESLFSQRLGPGGQCHSHGCMLIMRLQPGDGKLCLA